MSDAGSEPAVAVTFWALANGQMLATLSADMSPACHFKYTPATGSVMMTERYSSPVSVCRIISLRVRPEASRQRSCTNVCVVVVWSLNVFSVTVVSRPECGAPVNPVPDEVWSGIGPEADCAKETGERTSSAAIGQIATRILRPLFLIGFGGYPSR